MAGKVTRVKMQPVFKRVLACFENRAEFARATGHDRQLVNYWIGRGYIPAEYAADVAHATGGKVSMVDLVAEARREKLKRRVLKEARREAAEMAARARGDSPGDVDGPGGVE